MANMPTYLNVATQMREPWVVDQQALDHLKAEICSKTAQKQKVLLLLGHQCGDAIEDITRFSELLDADIISTPTGTRWVSAHNPRYKGVFGFSGHPSAKDALADPKLSRIIAVGTGLGETATAGWDTALLNNKLIHIESCAENFVQSPMAYMHVFGNIRSIFSELVDALLVRNEAESPKSHSRVPTSSINEDAIECSAERLPQQLRYYGAEKAYSDETPIKPQRLMHELSRLLPSHTRVYIDTGNSWAWGLHYLHLRLPGMQRLSMTFGSMGWAISAAVGSAVANRSAPFVCLTGDGSVLMSGQELTVAVEHHLPVLFVVLNDSGYGMIKHGQRLGGAESVGWQIPKVDFAVMARAMGANGIIIESVADLFSLNYDELFASSTPTLLDVRIDPDEVPPMGERVKILQQM